MGIKKWLFSFGKISVEDVIKGSFITILLWFATNFLTELIKYLIIFYSETQEGMLFMTSLITVEVLQYAIKSVLVIVLFKYIFEVLYRIAKTIEKH